MKWLLTGCLSSISVVLFFTRGCQESLWWLLRLFSMDLKFTVHRLETWLIGFKAWLSYSLTCSLSKSLRLSLPQFLYSTENTVLVLTAFRGLKCIKVRKPVKSRTCHIICTEGSPFITTIIWAVFVSLDYAGEKKEFIADQLIMTFYMILSSLPCILEYLYSYNLFFLCFDLD